MFTAENYNDLFKSIIDLRVSNIIDTYKILEERYNKSKEETENVRNVIIEIQNKQMDDKIKKYLNVKELNDLPINVQGTIGPDNKYTRFSILYYGNGRFKRCYIEWIVNGHVVPSFNILETSERNEFLFKDLFVDNEIISKEKRSK